MRLYVKKQSNETYYYITKSVRNGSKVNTVCVKNLGKHSDLLKIHENPNDYAQKVLEKMKLDEKEEKEMFISKISTAELESYKKRVSSNLSYNVGHLYLNKLYDKLNLDDFFKDITSKSNIEYDVNDIFRFLCVSRILDPNSKLKTHKLVSEYYGQKNINLQNIYKSMDILYKNIDSIQETLYKNSKNIIPRDTEVLYYDCTNFFFESTNLTELKRFGVSKEHRPNPIVQLGLFMDKNGIPLAFNIFRGNQNEQLSVKPLEEKLIHDFNISKFIYCADAGLNSNDIRLYNSFSTRDYLVTQPLKKLKQKDLDLVMTDENWQSLKTGRLTNISYIDDDDNDVYYKVLYIDNPVDVGIREYNRNMQIKKKTSFEQRLIITYNKQREIYQRNIRQKQIERASDILENKTYDKHNANSSKRFIKNDNQKAYELNLDRIEYEMSFDGYYAFVTSLESEIGDLLNITKNRYRIEESFRIMKTNLKARPVYHSLDERIVSHFIICFTSLLLYRMLDKLLENKYTIDEIIQQLTTMKVCEINKSVFKSIYSGSEMIKELENIFNLGLNRQAYTNVTLNKKTFKNFNKK